MFVCLCVCVCVCVCLCVCVCVCVCVLGWWGVGWGGIFWCVTSSVSSPPSMKGVANWPITELISSYVKPPWSRKKKIRMCQYLYVVLFVKPKIN